MLVQTEGASGGRYLRASGEVGRFRSAPLDGPIVDTYGAGDSFAAGLTYALGSGLPLDAALERAAHCGAAALIRRGLSESLRRNRLGRGACGDGSPISSQALSREGPLSVVARSA